MSIESNREREERPEIQRSNFYERKSMMWKSVERGGSRKAGIVEAESVGQKNPREVVQ